MAEINDLNVTDASNTGRFPEGQSAASLNNGARALEGMVARWHKDTNGSAAVAGTDTYTATINVDTGFALYDGYVFAGDFANANTGAATLNLTPDGGSALTAKAIVDASGAALAAGLIGARKHWFVYNGTDFQLLNPIPAVTASSTTTFTNKTLTSPVLNTGVSGTAVLDEDNMASDSATQLATQQSIKAYVDAVPSISQAVQSAIEAETNENTYVPPDLLHFAPSAAKAWIVFNGTAVNGAADLTGVDVSYNITSVVDNGTGDHTVAFDTDFSTAHYAMAGFAQGATSQTLIVNCDTAPAAGSVRLTINNDASTPIDSPYVSLIAFGDHA